MVVATRDRPHLLAGLLDALPAALDDRCELLVVDSASRTASTSDLCRARGVPVLRLERPGTSRARNAGIACTTADLVAVTDDDCLPQPGWAGALRAAFTDPSVGLVTGRVLPDGATAAPLSLTLEERSRDLTSDALIGHGANAAFRRAALDAVGGFDEQLGPGTPLRAAEDVDLFARLLAAGWSGRYCADAVVLHRQWRSRRSALGTAWSYGVGAGAAARRSGRSWRGPVVDEALLPAARDLRAGYLTGTASGLLRAAGAVIGTRRAGR